MNSKNSDCDNEDHAKVGYGATGDSILRIILVRHGESENNVYHEISLQAFEQNRVADPNLTARGQEQAEHVATLFAQQQNALLHPVHELWVSPMARALQTAQPLSRVLSPEKVNRLIHPRIYEVSGLHDRGVGQPGRTRNELQRDFPDWQVHKHITQQQGWYPVSQGRESNAQGRQRVRTVWNELVAKAQALTTCTTHTLVMVVHGDFTDYLLQAALGILPNDDDEKKYLPDDNDTTATTPTPTTKTKVFPTWNGSITGLEIPSSYQQQPQQQPATNHHNPRRNINGSRPTILFHNAIGHLPPDLVKTHKLGKC